MEECMRGSGTRIRDMEEGSRNILMETFILESLKKERLMERENMSGFSNVKYMMENGLKVLDMGMEYGKEKMVIVT
jgi:hypothetical protein